MKTTKKQRKPNAPSVVILAPELAPVPFWKKLKAQLDKQLPQTWRITIGVSQTEDVEITNKGESMTILFPLAHQPDFAEYHIGAEIIGHAQDLLMTEEEERELIEKAERIVRQADPAEERKKNILASITITETGDVWSIRETNHLLVIAGGNNKTGDPFDELVVVNPDRNEILLPDSYSIGDLGEAVHEAIDISTTRARLNERDKPA